MTYTLAMVGSIKLAHFRNYLQPDLRFDELPSGAGGGSPVDLLCEELLTRGRHVIVLTLDPAVDVGNEIVVEGPRLKIFVGPYRDDRAHDFFRAERAFLVRALQRERPDVVHAQWTYEHALAAQKSGLPHVITAHDAPLSVLRLNFIPYRIARTFMAYRVLSRAKRVVSVSPYVARHISRYMLYRGPTEVIPNGMPESLFAARATDRPAARPLTFASILQGWGKRKNGGVAIEAFAHFRREHPDSRLVLFGYGHGPGEEAELWAQARGMTDGIEFAGLLPHAALIAQLANEVDVLIHPALEEANPMALLEAMALGVPVIAGEDSGGTRWTLDEGRAGLLVDVTDAAAVAKAMAELAQPHGREMWGQRGLDLARQQFHIRHVADSYECVYDELLERR